MFPMFDHVCFNCVFVRVTALSIRPCFFLTFATFQGPTLQLPLCYIVASTVRRFYGPSFILVLYVYVDCSTCLHSMLHMFVLQTNTPQLCVQCLRVQFYLITLAVLLVYFSVVRIMCSSLHADVYFVFVFASPLILFYGLIPWVCVCHSPLCVFTLFTSTFLVIHVPTNNFVTCLLIRVLFSVSL